jgi:hypothetical protein
MRLNDRIVVAAISSLAVLGTSLVTAGGTGRAQTLPLITIKKFTNGQDADVAPGPSIPVGDQITWTYDVTNTTTELLFGIVVSDDQGVAVDCDNISSLAAGESMTCTGVGVATAGPYQNIGTVTALKGMQFAMASDASHYVGVESTGGSSLPPAGVKVPVCHRSQAGFHVLIQVAASAEPAHLAHGDARIGSEVPGQPGYVFGPECVVTLASPESSS